MVIAIFTVGNAIGKSLEDGKIKLDDFGHFFPALSKIQKAFDNAELIPRELADMDKEEAEELKACVKETFDISDDIVEQKIEEAFDLGADLFRFVKGFIKKG